MAHFKNDGRYLSAYNIFTAIAEFPIFAIYFQLILLQLEGIMGFQPSWLAPVAAILILVYIVFSRYFHLGEETLAYGLFTIIAYLIFLAWCQVTAPQGPHSVPLFGNPLQSSDTIMFAYSIRTVLTQNIMKHPDRG